MNLMKIVTRFVKFVCDGRGAFETYQSPRVTLFDD